jgi:hypothetical protein
MLYCILFESFNINLIHEIETKDERNSIMPIFDSIMSDGNYITININSSLVSGKLDISSLSRNANTNCIADEKKDKLFRILSKLTAESDKLGKEQKIELLKQDEKSRKKIVFGLNRSRWR